MSIGKILSGVGVLIGMYLIIANGDKSAKIIETIAQNSVGITKTLQGR